MYVVTNSDKDKIYNRIIGTGLSINAFSQASGFGNGKLYTWIQGKVKPSLAGLERLAKELSCEVKDFVVDGEEPKLAKNEPWVNSLKVRRAKKEQRLAEKAVEPPKEVPAVKVEQPTIHVQPVKHIPTVSVLERRVTLSADQLGELKELLEGVAGV